MSNDEILNKLLSHKLRFYEIDKIVGVSEAVALRRRAIEKLTGVRLQHVSRFSIDASSVVGRNIENMIGTVQIPLGIAGPIHVKGEYANGDYYLPLATTEGALVASVNRGCTVIKEGGGAVVRILKDEMTRAPVFVCENIEGVVKLIGWVKSNIDRMKNAATTTTSHGSLLGVEHFVTGRNVWLRFSFDTKDAMGMNMVTIATDAICDLILAENADVKLVSVSGNMCVDKKPSAINTIMGRGKTVVAEVVIPDRIVESKLKTTPEKLVEVNYRKNLLGSARACALGFNAHAANILSAMFIACGQDVAHVVEGSTAITTVEKTDTGVHVSVTLPSLQVGTVGGGTHVDTQRESLEILGVAGAGKPEGSNAKKLGEIIASAVLAGEISLIAAQAAHQLVDAHKRLGR
ncbi:MAG: 3-hydroxy-3-methylglutaryl-coenzyme A reductase [Candidatus Argoarchaeum ethanivorans]|uniref:3-hydroxy-3-methylglutaryl coenzyme A reductase n=1 Tax=Candidatus Argoarchaeum ethanivorans TaxID=2608793 RepID=A0A811ZZI4_9EURY|nr:MAG: 3-hydroxy-3-methylglutaryl-coenzyme A reductase [Candidatus Argoarchaeum ethanivorans]